MKHAPILILDDSVSAVDTKTERTILRQSQKREGLTTILIAHTRISTGGADGQDRVRRGTEKSMQSGKHEDLYRTCTAYRKMVDLQKILKREAGEGRNAQLLSDSSGSGAIIGVISTLLIVGRVCSEDGERNRL